MKDIEPTVLSHSLTKFISDTWKEHAGRQGIDLSGFDPSAPLCTRLTWAKGNGLMIGSTLARYSSQLQHSTDAQVRDNLQCAAQHMCYVPPEYVFVDEAVSGRKDRRVGINLLKELLKTKAVQILFVFKVSRLFRVSYRGFQFFQEEVVDEGVRGISVSQGIDTDDGKKWKHLLYLHGIMDDLLLGTIADHVYSGIRDLFLKRYVTGALAVGYYPKEVPDAKPTNLGGVRKAPAVNPDVAALIVKHYEWIRDGMSVAEGWRRWVKSGGPCDPRSNLGYMSERSYRRMLSNHRYRGIWAFGRKKSVWINKLDYARQIDRPEEEVAVFQCDDLRIMSDELFFAVQERLSDRPNWGGGPKKDGPHTLADLVVRYFRCAVCDERFHYASGGGRAMHCKLGTLCPSKHTIKRQTAVEAVCKELQRLIDVDAELLELVLEQAAEHSEDDVQTLLAHDAEIELKVKGVAKKIDYVIELAGLGSETDRDEMTSKIRILQEQRAALLREKEQIATTLAGSKLEITGEDVRDALHDIRRLLQEGASGELGQDLVHRAAAVFGQLVGGKILVHLEHRPGRKRGYIRGVFTPNLLQTARSVVGALAKSDDPTVRETSVWLRAVPQADQHAEAVHQLIDIEKLSFRDAEAVMTQRGIKGNSGKMYQFYVRYYEMIGKPLPKLPYNNGRPAKRTA